MKETGLPERKNELKIETIKTPEGNEVSFCPERGGVITSLKFKGVEILYMDRTTLENLKLSVKGGIPTLFPNSGVPENTEPPQKFPHLKKHGFARDMNSWQVLKGGRRFIESIVSDDYTKSTFPFDWKHSLSGQFNNDGSFTIIQTVENLEQEKEIPIAMGLHPYFRAPFGNKSEIKFEFAGGSEVEENVTIWANGGTYVFDNPKVVDPKAVMNIVIPDLGILTMDVGSEYRRIKVWSLPGKDFVCIEPVMRDNGALAEDPEKVSAGLEYSAEVNIKFIKLGKIGPHPQRKIR